jgi:hypothetical protein
MAFDSVRSRVVLFGGYDFVGRLGDTWTFDGTDWIQGPAGPSARETAMAFDPVRGVVVLFGGVGPLQDTWEWNGSAWTQRFPAQRPAARGWHAMAFDPIRQATVLFGGHSFSSPPNFGDTWTWNGTNWQQLAVSGPSPAPRQFPALAFDPCTGSMLLFGGMGDETYEDTWTLTGATWTQRQPANTPFARGGHAMVSDVHRRRVVLFGDSGRADAFSWEWDGTNWSQRFLASPGPRYQPGFAYDTIRRQSVQLGGSSPTSWYTNSTWVYRTDQPADFAPLGPGCPGSFGTPLLAAAQYSLPWLGDVFASEVAPAPVGGPVFVVTGQTATVPSPLDPYGLPGCTLFVSPLATDLVFVGVGGVAQWSLVIPNSPPLAGVGLAQQAFVLDPVGAAGAAVSSACTMRIGVR